jgi:hypothetical protein
MAGSILIYILLTRKHVKCASYLLMLKANLHHMLTYRPHSSRCYTHNTPTSQ